MYNIIIIILYYYIFLLGQREGHFLPKKKMYVYNPVHQRSCLLSHCGVAGHSRTLEGMGVATHLASTAILPLLSSVRTRNKGQTIDLTTATQTVMLTVS